MEGDISVCSECGDRTRDPSCFFRCPRCGDVCCPDHISEHDCKTREQEQVDGLEPGWVKLLRSKLAEQAAEIERLRNACISQERDISQTLGKALGYPWFKDDPTNWPNATEADGVCVGEHVAESLADEAAKKLAEQTAEIERLTKERDESERRLETLRTAHRHTNEQWDARMERTEQSFKEACGILEERLVARDAMLAAATETAKNAVELVRRFRQYNISAWSTRERQAASWASLMKQADELLLAAVWLKPSPGEAGRRGAV